jgi:predicted amidohydrolase
MMKLALAQLKGALNDKTVNLRRALEVIHECKKKDVDYVLFPELFLSGYFIRDTIHLLAEPAEGPSIQMLQRTASATGVGIIMGFPELCNDKYYNSAVFIDKDGNVRGLYRKIHLFDEEPQFFTPGEKCPIFDIPEGKLALMMTFDLEFPELPRLYALRGIDMLMVLNAHTVPFEPHQELFLRARAVENQVFVAAANKVGLECNTLFFGVSGVISPQGEFLVKGGNNEELLVATIDFADVRKTREQQPMRYLQNRRPRIYLDHGLF